jgi:hypothetical protein
MWKEQFLIKPENTAGYTMITCTSPIHGVCTYYVNLEMFHKIYSVISAEWVNGFTILIQPMDQ